ncbi:MAG: hypothetical protein A2X56_07145 [Nitrospirae bacterium GWC2_57_13]|nr:MAG: hypothetical protein A2X56_07145 [Nitrospirae bacterium GWC2_57_13]
MATPLHQFIMALMRLRKKTTGLVAASVAKDDAGNEGAASSRSPQFLQAILSQMPCGVMLLDRDGRVLLINPLGARILRRHSDTLIGRMLQDVVPGTQVFMDPDAAACRELELLMPEGMVCPIGYLSAPYVDPDGMRNGVIVQYQDLSVLKALLSKGQDKERFVAVGRVVAGVAHEIKNPLFGISSVAQIFERELINPIHRELAQALLAETRRLNHLVDELLVYGRPMKLRAERCDLSRLLEEVFQVHRREIREKGIVVRDEQLVPKIITYVDSGQIRQVFLNLLRNAVDAMPRGGEIALTLLLEDRYIIFSLADEGEGIPAQIFDRVYDLFFTTKKAGTGLGLTICRKIVQDHGGEIILESTEGKGTTVTVKLPYRGASDAPGAGSPGIQKA